MIYAMSDIHGQYEQFLTLLEQIGIRKEDTLYILGDVVDRGPEPMKILKYMMAHSNIIPIIGNHEVMALPNLKLLVPEVSRNFLDKLPTKVYRDFDNWTRIDYEIPYFNDIIVVSGIHRHRISLGTTA